MASVVDIMDKAFYNVLIEWEKIVDEDLMMGICDGITKKLLPLQEYLGFMFENKQDSLLGSRKDISVGVSLPL